MRSVKRTTITLLLLFVAAMHAKAQPPTPSDSAVYEEWLAGINRRKSVVANARLVLAEHAKRGQWEAVQNLRAFMDHRQNDGPWLNHPERLLMLVLLTDTAAVLNPVTIGRLLAETEREAGGLQPDGVRQRLREILRSSATATSDRFDSYGLTEGERRFFNLLLNHLTIRGYRAQEELNTLVDQFGIEYPRSPLREVADAYFRREYSEQIGGLGIVANYGGGTTAGALGKRFGKFHGLTVEIEGYLYQATVTGSIQFNALSVPQQFSIGHDTWGDASMTAATLGVGYEFRQGRFAFTPMLGLATTSIESGDAVHQQERATTGAGLGFDLAGIADYRIPFDEGPHINLRARVGYSGSGLSDYDPTFAGGIAYLRFGFGLVYRPYVGKATGK